MHSDAAKDVQRDLEGLGTVLLFLNDSSPVFAYAPGVLGTVWDGELIAQVDSAGKVSLPALEAEGEDPQSAGCRSGNWKPRYEHRERTSFSVLRERRCSLENLRSDR